jgi:hypothetical protein
MNEELNTPLNPHEILMQKKKWEAKELEDEIDRAFDGILNIDKEEIPNTHRVTTRDNSDKYKNRVVFTVTDTSTNGEIKTYKMERLVGNEASKALKNKTPLWVMLPPEETTTPAQ